MNELEEIKPKVILSESSRQEHYEELFKLNVGDVFMIRSDYETVMERIEHYKPTTIIFEVFPINPGTSLYTVYGPDHCIVTDKRLKQSDLEH